VFYRKNLDFFHIHNRICFIKIKDVIECRQLFHNHNGVCEVEKMQQITYKTTGICATEIHFERDEQNCIHNVIFDGGCSGNLTAIAKLCEGLTAEEISRRLKGNLCGTRGTSCADQLAIAVMSGLTA